MRKNRILMISALLILASAIINLKGPHGTLLVESSAQEPKVADGAYYSGPKGPEIEGTAAGETVQHKRTEANGSSSVLNHAMPDVWLVLPVSASKSGSENGLRVDLPPMAIQVLSQHWQDSLDYYFELEYGPKLGVQHRANRIHARYDSFQKARTELKLLPINLLAGPRNISENEANSLLVFLTLAAIDLIKEAKESRPPS